MSAAVLVSKELCSCSDSEKITGKSWNGLGWKGLLGSNTLPWAGITSTRPAWSGYHPTWPWMLLRKSPLLTLILCWKINPLHANQALLLLETVLEQLSPNPTHCSVAATHLNVFSFPTNGNQEINSYFFLQTDAEL